MPTPLLTCRGSESGHSCAFKNATSQAAVFYNGYVPPSRIGNATKVSWSAAPNCTHALEDTNYDVDGCGRKWGWENATSCKFVDAVGNPAYVTLVGNSQPCASPVNTSAATATDTRSDSMQELMRAIMVLLQNFIADNSGAAGDATPAAAPLPSPATDATSQADAAGTA
jgi:hypothetical protein